MTDADGGQGLAILFPGVSGNEPFWWRIEGGALTMQGRGAWPEELSGGKVALLLPPGLVSARFFAAPEGRPPAQAMGVAAAEAKGAAIADEKALHGCALDLGEAAGVARYRGYAVAADDLRAALGWAEERGIDPAAVLPLDALVTRPEQGWAQLEWADGETLLLRGDVALCGREPFAATLLAGAEPVSLPLAAFERALADMLTAPPCDFRTGPFARARRWGLERAPWRRWMWLAAAALILALLAPLVSLTRLHLSTRALEAQALEMARGQGVTATNLSEARLMLDEKLAARGTGPALFSSQMGALVVALQGEGGLSVTAVDRSGDGVLRVRLEGRQPAMAAVVGRMRTQGYDAALLPASAGGAAELVVRP